MPTEYNNDDLYKALKELNVVDSKELDQAYRLATKEKRSLADIIISRELLSDENMGKMIANTLDLPFIRLTETPIPADVLKIIPAAVAREHKTIVFKRGEKQVHIATPNPDDLEIKEIVYKKTGFQVVVHYATERDVSRALSLYKKDIEVAFADIISQNIKQAKGKDKAEPPIIKIVDTILDYAFENNASDVHIEPLDEYSLVRFRIDGILQDIIRLPIEIHPRIVTRIKVLSALRTDEHQSPQDGKISHRVLGEDLDIRVSIVPITGGEKIVMRLLSEHTRQFSLTDLGFSPPDLKKVEPAYKKPHGMILVTGPTGSGKTTTLYAILKILNKRSVNIMTIEDPVEYAIEGINQIQTNRKTKLTFATGLRSIVRQDPDIVLVGEIRDEETADIAINAAMTGHLVLSTLHTNDSATAFPRLLDMKVEPYLVASTVNVVVAQRLVRKICTTCRVSVDLDIKVLKDNFNNTLVQKYFKGSSKGRVYEGKGCKVCHGTGYSGRIGIFEVLIVDDKVRQAIVDHKDSSVIQALAVSAGMTTMSEDGLRKVSEGETTVEEVLRVTKE